MQKNDIVYWARIRDSYSEYDVIELKIRTVNEDWFVGTEKRTKQSFYFNMKDLNKIVFYERQNALEVAIAAENRKRGEKVENV